MLVAGIILIVFSVFLIVAVLMQQGKSHNLSGTIAGGAETFFGKSKGQTVSKKLSIVTSIVAIIFVILVVSVYVMQDNNKSSLGNLAGEDKVEIAGDTTAAEETTAVADTTAANN